MATTSQQTRISNRYVIGELLGQGLGSTVARGEDETLRRLVAIKQVRPDFTAAYRAALGATARIGHPAYIGVYDALEHDGQLVIIQEYVIGQRFTELAHARLSTATIARIGRQLALALAHAHRQGVAHGDLTPAALFRDQWGAMRINNILLPPDAAYFAAASHLLKPGEDIWAVETPTPRDDLRAMGVALWLLLAGRETPPPEATGAQADWDLTGRDVPLPLRDIIDGLIDSDHPRALDSAEAAVGAFGMIIGGEEAPRRSAPPWSLPPSRPDVAETNPSHHASPASRSDSEPPTQPNVPFSASALRPSPSVQTRMPTARTVVTTAATVPAPTPSHAPLATPSQAGRFDNVIWVLLGLGLFVFWVVIGYLASSVFAK